MTYQEGVVRGLVDVCLKKQADDISETGSSWLTDDYIKGLMYDTVTAGKNHYSMQKRLALSSPVTTLTLCILMDSSFWFDTINLELSIVHI